VSCRREMLELERATREGKKKNQCRGGEVGAGGKEREEGRKRGKERRGGAGQLGGPHHNHVVTWHVCHVTVAIF
jgi:hypothetical protein